MRRGRASRLSALVGAVALGFATGSVAVPIAPDPSGVPTEVAGVVHLRGGSGAATPSHPTYDRISRLRQPEGTVTAAGGQAVSAPAPPAPPAGDTVIAPPPESFDTAAAPPPPPPPKLRPSRWEGVEPTGGTWALIIGINDYPGSRHDLRSAVADADDVNIALEGLGVPGDHRVVLRDAQANKGTILAGLEWLRAHAGPDAVAVVFYAGHVRRLGNGVEAMVGSDGQLITDRELADELSGLQAQRAWIAIAACYAGGFTEVGAPGRILTGAAPANALAYENSEFGRSYMVEYMVRRAMLERRADGSVEAAFGFAESELRRDYPNRLPVQYDWAEGDLDLRPDGGAQSQPPPPPRDNAPPPPDSGSGGSGSGSDGSGSGSGGSGGGDDDETDTCSSLTVIIRCREN